MNNFKKPLFTPGPLTTSDAVKKAMARDLGSRDPLFSGIIEGIHKQLLTIADVDDNDYQAIILQGCGTIAIESVLSSCTPQDGKWLIVANGQYGQRIGDVLEAYQIPMTRLSLPYDKPIDVNEVRTALDKDPDITHVAMVHCETTTGLLNDINAVGTLAKDMNKVFLVDAMSSFGGIPIDFEKAHIDFLVASPNKCLESVPGFGFVIAKIDVLEKKTHISRNYTLDLLAQWKYWKAKKQFRFTPPIQVFLAFEQALKEWCDEGGFEGRSKRYQKHYEMQLKGMATLGFKPFLPSHYHTYIITAYRYPENEEFDFNGFYQSLSNKGFIIYPGKISKEDYFRIGHIGKITPQDIEGLLQAMKETLCKKLPD